ncbi:MAG: TlpA family protein disulfide reductase [Clostridia bacterium]|nr:TlpA family protein disulfide reductase [Clostridia bacterium]
MKVKKSIGAIIVSLISVIFCGVFYGCGGSESSGENGYKTGNTVSNFTLTEYFDEENGTYKLQDDLDENRVVVLYFWYIGCSPCEEDIPELGGLAEQYSDKLSVVIAHSSEINASSIDMLETYVKDTKNWSFYSLDNVHFTLDNSGGKSVYDKFGGDNVYPTVAVIDGNGTLRFSYSSVLTDGFYTDLQTLLR